MGHNLNPVGLIGWSPLLVPPGLACFEDAGLSEEGASRESRVLTGISKTRKK